MRELNTEERKHIIIYSSHGIKDPLLEGLMLVYLKQVNLDNEYVFHLFTEEQTAYTSSEKERKAIRSELEQQGILWYPQKYRNGRGIIFKKAYGFFERLLQCRRIKKKHNAKMILGFLAIAGGYAFIISRIVRLKLSVFCFEPHSEYMKDFNVWSPNSPSFKLLRFFEKQQVKKADFITGPTRYTIDLFKKYKAKGLQYKLPISIDEQQFRPNYEARNRLRKKLGFENQLAVLYLGKFGGIYYSLEEVALFYRAMLDKLPDLVFYTITTSETNEVEAAFINAGLPKESYKVLNKIPYSEIADYINAADIGVVAVPPLPSQVYRTPVKIGNYLACGIPFIVNKGVGDDDELAVNENVGIAFDSLDPKESSFSENMNKLSDLLKEDDLSVRCVKVAHQYRGVHNSINVLKEIFAHG